jgi:hypothetical protein
MPWAFLLCLAVPALADRYHHSAAREISSEPTLLPTSTLPTSPDAGSLQPSSTQDPLWPEPPTKPVPVTKRRARSDTMSPGKESSAPAKRSAKKAKAKSPHVWDWADVFRQMGGVKGYW